MLTEFIHPDGVFMVHGFGHTLPAESRAIGKGILDNDFMPAGLEWRESVGSFTIGLFAKKSYLYSPVGL
jgi:thiosulfate reductase / polysulfide reductase chain A